MREYNNFRSHANSFTLQPSAAIIINASDRGGGKENLPPTHTYTCIYRTLHIIIGEGYTELLLAYFPSTLNNATASILVKRRWALFLRLEKRIFKAVPTPFTCTKGAWWDGKWMLEYSADDKSSFDNKIKQHLRNIPVTSPKACTCHNPHNP